MTQMILTFFSPKITYDKDWDEFRYIPTGDYVRLWDDRNVIYHETTRKCYQYHNATNSLMTIDVEHCPMGTRFLLCKDKVLRQKKKKKKKKKTGQISARQKFVTHSLIRANRKTLLMMLMTQE